MNDPTYEGVMLKCAEYGIDRKLIPELYREIRARVYGRMKKSAADKIAQAPYTEDREWEYLSNLYDGVIRAPSYLEYLRPGGAMLGAGAGALAGYGATGGLGGTVLGGGIGGIGGYGAGYAAERALDPLDLQERGIYEMDGNWQAAEDRIFEIIADKVRRKKTP